MSNIYQDCTISRGGQPRAKYQLPVSVLEEAFKLPLDILTARRLVIEATAEYDEIKLQVAEEESILMSLIQAAQKPDGKPMYTNAEQRSAAMVEAKKGSTSWVVLSQSLAERMTELNEARDNLQYFQDRLALIRRAMALAAAELELLSSGQYVADAAVADAAVNGTANNAYQAY